jgi:hypothetical protein
VKIHPLKNRKTPIKARQAQVFGGRRAAVFLGDDVVDLEGE